MTLATVQFHQNFSIKPLQNLTVSEIDLCVIIGNLLNNAIEACLRTEDQSKRFIRVYMDLKRDNLYLCVTNTSSSSAIKKVSKGTNSFTYLSSKGENHGFGLMRVDNIIDKYGGYIKRRDEDGAFTCEVMLPI